MRKDVDTNSMVLQKIESDVRGLQRRISLATDSLVRRIEALECGKESHVSRDRGYIMPWTTQNGCCKDAIRRFDTLEATVKDLQDRLHACSCNILTQTSSPALVQELHTQDFGHAFRTPDASEVCSESDPSHVMCLEALKRKWDEIQAASSSGDGAELLERIASGASTMTILEVGNIDSESWFSSDAMLGSAISNSSHKASRFLVPSPCRETQQSILDSVPPKTHACDGDTRTATAVGAESVDGVADQGTYLHRML